tara:strand:+ start:82 stop:675 length:594 start_codon:yes stop_codon:yes gene_type:complete
MEYTTLNCNPVKQEPPLLCEIEDDAVDMSFDDALYYINCIEEEWTKVIVEKDFLHFYNTCVDSRPLLKSLESRGLDNGEVESLIKASLIWMHENFHTRTIRLFFNISIVETVLSVSDMLTNLIERLTTAGETARAAAKTAMVCKLIVDFSVLYRPHCPEAAFHIFFNEIPMTTHFRRRVELELRKVFGGRSLRPIIH